MTEARFYHPMEVRYGDIDAQGHLNNAKFLTFFEQGRIRYFEELGLFAKGQSFMDIGVIVGDIHIRFRAPVMLDANVKVGVRAARVGSKSITMEQSIVDADSGQVYADGTVILVTYDYHAHKTVPVSDEWRRVFAGYEGIGVHDAS